MARVFLATETALGRQVVIKVLGPELASEISGERFAREVRLAASLQHPNIVPVLATGVADGIPFYTMPFVRGQSLRDRIREFGAVPVRQAISILRDIARALDHAHAAGVVHRDIKPENVLLSGDAAVVTDFGIAKAISAAHATTSESGEHTPRTLTQAGLQVGTPAYMSPEQAAGDSVDSRTDIYAWGLIAYEMLTGSHPFADRETAAHIIAAHISKDPAPLDTTDGLIPVPLANVVMQSLLKAPDGRPPSAGDLIDRLDESRESRDNPTVERKPPVKRSIRMPVMIAAIAIVVITGGYFFAKRFGLGTGKASISSVAVLPFTHDQADSTEAYFGEGIADELMTALSKVPDLRVASRTSAIAMGSRRDLDVREIAQKLGVSSIVEGTVRRYGGKLRVSAQLTNANDGLIIWSEAYDGEAKDVFGVQSDITQGILSALRPGSSSRDVSAASKGTGTSDPEAYDYYLRGLYLLERRGAGVKRSVDLFTKAIEKDPNFAKAYAALAGALEFFPYFAGVPAHVVEPRAKAAALKALEIDPSLAEPRVALAMADWHALRWDEADRQFRRAIQDDSTSAVARTQYGRFLVSTKRIPEAIKHLRIAQRLDPLAATSTVWLAQALGYSGDHEAANKEIKKSIELDPTFLTNRTILLFEVIRQGRLKEARAIMGDDVPSAAGFAGQTAHHLELVGEKARAAAVRKQLMATPDSVWTVHIGRVYALLGVRDTAGALTEMESAVRAREIIAAYLPLVDPVFDQIRGSRRFAAILDQLGLRGRGLDTPLEAKLAR